MGRAWCVLLLVTGCAGAAGVPETDAGEAPDDAEQVWIDVPLRGPYGGACDSGATCASWVDR